MLTRIRSRCREKSERAGPQPPSGWSGIKRSAIAICACHSVNALLAVVPENLYALVQLNLPTVTDRLWLR